MERRLNDVDWSPGDTFLDGSLVAGEAVGDEGDVDGEEAAVPPPGTVAVREKDKIIKHLESEVEQQVSEKIEIIFPMCLLLTRLQSSIFLIPASTPFGGRQAGGGQGCPNQGLGHEQAQGAGGAEPTPQGPERPRQRSDGAAEKAAGATPGHEYLSQKQQTRGRRNQTKLSLYRHCTCIRTYLYSTVTTGTHFQTSLSESK